MAKQPAERGRPPPKPKGEGLDEVERALSILDGRHPEHTRLKREQDAALAKKRAEQDGQEVKEQKSKLARGLVVGLVFGGLIAGAWSIYARRMQAGAIDAALEPLAAPFVASGFSLVRTANGRLEESVEPGCFVALAPAPRTLEVEHGGEAMKGDASLGWCACNPEHVLVVGKIPGSAISPLRLLRIEGRVVGGIDGFASLTPRPATLSARPEECLSEQFDAWITDKRYPASPVPGHARDPEGDAARLHEIGFVPVAGAAAEQAFAVVEPAAESCHIAFSRAAGDLLSLRISGGERPLRSVKGSIAWCDAGAHTHTVWREGKGEVVVLSAPAMRLGGLFGLGEKLLRARLPAVTTWVSSEDLPWDAAQILRASGVGDITPTLGGAITEPKSPPEGRLVALSAQGGGAFVDPHGEVVCDPKPDDASPASREHGLRRGVCAQLLPQAWRQRGTAGAVGVVQAPLPFWLSVLAPVKDPEVMQSMVALLGLARRLRGEGFEPTTLEGVTESASGVEVIGRAGDNAVVAVGLGPKAPYVFPYSDGLAWTLGGDPRVVELKPGERALLSAEHEPTVPKDARRTVVFRRSASASH